MKLFAATFLVGILAFSGCGGGGGASTPAIVTPPPPPAAPSNLVYGVPSATYTVGTTIAANTPAATGNPTSYSVNPALPAGLSLSVSSGTISGTPTGVKATATYTVTASNAGGSATATITITVNDVALGALTYTTNPATYTIGVAITANSPHISGGTATGYTISPAVPSGLSLNPTSGVITGTPGELKATTIYSVQATGTNGTSSVSLTITVNDVAPTSVSYTGSPFTFTVGSNTGSLTPNTTGGVATDYSVSPYLPNGIALNPSTGVINGNPMVASSSTNHTITASNSGGSASTVIAMTVNSAPTTPASYSAAVITQADPGTFTIPNKSLFAWVGVPITTQSPSTITGLNITYSVNPALPAGLTLNTSTGAISGTPTAQTSLTTYTITATNSGGSTSVPMPIRVSAALPVGVSVPDPKFQEFLTSMGVTITGGQVLVADAAKVTSIEITSAHNIQSIEGIEAFVNLSRLEVDHNPVASVNLSNAGNLLWFVIWDDLALTSIDVTPLTNVQLLGLSMTGLTSVDLSKNTTVLELDLQNSSDDPTTPWGTTQGLTSLDISHNTNLWRLYCSFNRISSLNTMNNPQLSEVWAEVNQLVSLDFTHNPQMYVMVLYNNNLNYLNIKGCGVPRTCTTFYPTANPPISAGLSNKNQNLTQIWVDNVAAIQAWAIQYPVWYSQGPQTSYVQ